MRHDAPRETRVIGRFEPRLILLASAATAVAWVPGDQADTWAYWSIDSMPMEYFVEDEALTIASFAELAVTRGIDQWGAVPTSYIATSYQGLTADLLGRNGVTFLDLGPSTTGMTGRTHDFLPPSGRDFPVIFEVKINETMGWDVDRMSKTAAHELGHLLGLDHVAIADAVMYYRNHPTWTLHQDEIDAASFLHAFPQRRPVAWWTTMPPQQGGMMLRIATPATVTFDASMSFDADGQIVEYRWDFGDGTTATTSSPTIEHTYALGTMSPTWPRLEIIDDHGKYDRAGSTIILPRDGPDVAPPTVSLASPCGEATLITEADRVTLQASYTDDLGVYFGFWRSDRPIVPPQGHFNLHISGMAGTFELTDVPLELGINTVTVDVIDYPGNLATHSVVVERVLPGQANGATCGSDPEPDPEPDPDPEPEPEPEASSGEDASPSTDDVVNGDATASGCSATRAELVLALAALLVVRTTRRRTRIALLVLGSTMGCVTAPPAVEPELVEPWAVRHRALWDEYKVAGVSVVPRAVAALEDADARNRRAGAEILGYCGDAGMVVTDGLRARLVDADRHVRHAAISSLGRLRATEAGDDLRALRADDPWTELRRRAALIRLGDAASEQWLEALERSPDAAERYRAAMVIGLVGAPLATRLVALLGDDAPTGRRIEQHDPQASAPERVRDGALVALRHLARLERVAPEAGQPLPDLLLQLGRSPQFLAPGDEGAPQLRGGY